MGEPQEWQTLSKPSHDLILSEVSIRTYPTPWLDWSFLHLATGGNIIITFEHFAIWTFFHEVRVSFAMDT